MGRTAAETLPWSRINMPCFYLCVISSFFPLQKYALSFRICKKTIGFNPVKDTVLSNSVARGGKVVGGWCDVRWERRNVSLSAGGAVGERTAATEGRLAGGSSADRLNTGRRICIRCNYRLQRSGDRNGYEKRTGPLNFSGPIVGAQDRTRTCTLSLALVPETSVSTNSTTWAWLVGCPGFRSPERSANIRKNRNRANFSEIFLFQSFARMVFAGVTVVCRTAAEGKEADSGCGRGRRKGGGERAGVFPVAAGPFALLLRGRAGEPQRERAEQFGRNWKEQSVGCRRKRPVAVGVTGAVCGRFRFRQTHDGYERESPVGASRGTVLLRQYVRKV